MLFKAGMSSRHLAKDGGGWLGMWCLISLLLSAAPKANVHTARAVI